MAKKTVKQKIESAPQDGPRVRSSGMFKLKDKGGRDYQVFDLMKQFGFKPDMVIVQKVRGENNTLRFHGVLTEEEIKKEDALLQVNKQKHDRSNRTNKPRAAKQSAKASTRTDDVSRGAKARDTRRANNKAGMGR